MCGIYGVYNLKEHPVESFRKPLERLSTLSYRRGKEAAGMAVMHDTNQVDYIKSDLDGKKLLKTRAYQDFIRPFYQKPVRLVLGHSRIATHGSQLSHQNNQPVISQNGRVFGVHNGIITNIETLWESMGNESPIPDLDTQVLFDYLEMLCREYPLDLALKYLFKNIEGAASIAIGIPTEQVLILGSNTGSLYYALVGDQLFFASELVFLRGALTELSHESICQIQPGTFKIFAEAFTAEDQLARKIIVSSATLSPRYVNRSASENLSSAIHHYTFVNDAAKLKRHDFDYAKIYAINRCTRCVLPATTPFIIFNRDGVCNFCLDHEKISHKGYDALEEIVRKIRKGTGEPDCMAAFSGGRDSSFGLHFLKKELGLQPLAYTYDWGMVTDIARRNQARILGQLGIEHIVVSADITTKRKHIRQNILAWMKKPDLGMVPLFMQGDKQCEFYAEQLMKQYNLKMMFFFRGNELEKEEFKNGHCGIKDADEGGVIHNLPLKNKLRLLGYYGTQYLLNPAYFNASFFDTALAYFSTYVQPHDYLYLWHYIPWEEEKIIGTLKREYHWETPRETQATWRTDDGSSAFYNYIYYMGQGFTENDSFRSRQVREGILSREDAWRLVCEENKPRYEALQWYFDMIGIDGDQVLTAVDHMKKLY